MARITAVTLVDDLDGGAAEESVSFCLEAKSYEIDLSGAHAQALRDALAPFVAAGRRLTGPAASVAGRSSADTGSRRSRAETAAIRDWAVGAGFTVADRGRIPSSVLEAYESRDGTSGPASADEDQPTPPGRAHKPTQGGENGDRHRTGLFREAGA